MLLLSSAFLPSLLGRLSGEDGYYTAFRLAFYYGTDPRNIRGLPRSAVLAQFDFSSPWATPRDGNHVTRKGPTTTTVITSGIASYWRLLGLHDGEWSNLVHGSVGLIGSEADIKVRTLEWMLGDPLRLDVIQIYPIKLSY